ncbi:MAG TPA: oligosaccharide flippase family protein [Bacteroidales bacterium]|nr:oligosaccharide flippase family protein [Bacteroidales bacterium]HNS46797.1 oligosaccharide flippase family protein [Bacteroidales bacterium]
MAQRSFFKDVSGVLISNVVTIVSGLLASVILSRKLGPEGFGIYSAILVIPLIVVSFTQLGIRGSSIYHLGRKKYEQAEIVGSILLILAMTSLLGILITGTGFLILGDESFTRLYMILVVLSIPFRLAMAYFGGIFIGKEQIGKANFINWFSELIHLVAVAALVWFMELGIAGALLSLLAANTLITLWAGIKMGREYGFQIRYRSVIIRDLISMGFLFALAFMVIQLNYRIDILLLQELSTKEEVGFYSLGVSIAEKLWQLPLAIGVVLMSRTANAANQDLINQTTGRLVRVSIIAGLIASAVLAAVSPWLIPAIWGDNFQSSVRIIQTILPGILFISIFRILSSRLSGIGKPHISIYVFLPALILNILLNLWWIPRHGALGAVWATNVSYSLGTVAYVFIYSKIVHVPVRRIFEFHRSDFMFISEFRKWKIR